MNHAGGEIGDPPMHTGGPVALRAPRNDDARELLPYLQGTGVLQDIFWDGPASANEFYANWAVVVEEVAHLKRHYFVITLTDSSVPIGCCQVSPDARFFRAEVGLWLGAPHQGRGFGTAVIRDLTSYAFDKLHVHKLDAEIFVGNWRSRTAFEKNGFAVEGTIRAAVLKLGEPRDVWHMGLLNPRSRLSGSVDAVDGVTG